MNTAIDMSREPDFTKARAIVEHPLAWLFEPLEDCPSYERRTMFGCQAAYLGGNLTLLLAAKEEPLNGVMVATAHEHHASLREQWPALKPHPILGKWLYLSQRHAQFETVAIAIVKAVRNGDPRIGVAPKPRKRL